MRCLRVIAADSSAALLDEKFEPLSIVAAASVLVDSPYREASVCLAEPIFADAKRVYEVVIHEAQLCKQLIGRVKADVVHLDISLGSVSLEQLSPIQLTSMRISTRARRHLLKTLPRIRKIAYEITQKHGVEVLAIGKESIPVRVAELTSGAHAILYACEKSISENDTVLLGLPSKCQPLYTKEKVYLYSLIGSEHDVKGYAEDRKKILGKISIVEMLNPRARGFRILRITPTR